MSIEYIIVSVYLLTYVTMHTFISSERIAARGSSSSIVLAAAKTASMLVPWWNTEMLFSRVKQMLGYSHDDSTAGDVNGTFFILEFYVLRPFFQFIHMYM
jgi:hypothetical protein